MNEKLELTEEEVNVYSDDCGKIQVVFCIVDI